MLRSRQPGAGSARRSRRREINDILISPDPGLPQCICLREKDTRSVSQFHPIESRTGRCDPLLALILGV